MNNTFALFGGQGAQYSGMGKNLYDNFISVRRIYECAGDIFGYDVANTSFSGTTEELMKTEIAQSALFTLGVATYDVAKEKIGNTNAVAGHSLGEYAALCCAGAFSLEDGMRLIKVRAHAMAKAAANQNGCMYAIIGKGAAEVDGV